MRITTTLTGPQVYPTTEVAKLVTLLSRAGAPGVKGSVWYAGVGEPDDGDGTAGDFYIATDTLCLYGPKTTVWGASFACVAGTILTADEIDVLSTLATTAVTFDPTGFIDNDNIGVAYDTAARTITLTHASGTIQYKWRGQLKSLASPWTSSAHAVGASRYFLSSADGDTFAWSTAVWSFNEVHVAAAFPALGFAVREPHGVMQYETHIEAHDLLGTYRVSGLGPVAGTYTEATASDAATTPGFAAGVIKDEDNASTVNASAEGTYTTLRVNAGAATFDTAASFPFRSSGSYIFTNNPTTGAETATATNRFVNVYEILLPVTSDADSQKFRRVFLQPQAAYTSLAAAQAEDTRGLSLGDLSGLAPELVFYTRITYATLAGNANTGKVTIPTGGVTYVVGTRVSQINVGAVLQATTAENVSYSPTAPDTSDDVQEALDNRQLRLATIVDKGVSFNTSTLDDVTDNAKMLNCTAAITITLETYTDKPEGFQFGGMAAGGIVTFVGTYERVSTFDKVPVDGMFYVIRKADGWHVGGVTT